MNLFKGICSGVRWTMLQKRSGGGLAGWAGVDPIHDANLIVVHFHALHHRFDDITFCFLIGGGQALFDLHRERFQAADDQAHLSVAGLKFALRLDLRFQLFEMSSGGSRSRFELRFFDQPVSERIDQASDRAARSVGGIDQFLFFTGQ